MQLAKEAFEHLRAQGHKANWFQGSQLIATVQRKEKWWAI